MMSKRNKWSRLMLPALVLFVSAGNAQDSVQLNTRITAGSAVEQTLSRPARDAAPVYRLKPKVDIPVTLIGAAWSGYAFTKIYSKDPSTVAEVMALRTSDINSFDRWAAKEFDPKAGGRSDLLFYGSMPLPLVLLLDKEMRKDAGKLGFLYLESMAITGLLYTGSTYLTNRYRPLTYDPNVPMEIRTKGGQKNSFFAGHVALVGTSTFFIAKTYQDYHPGSPLNKFLFGGAIAATGATAYLRHRGGKHFPTDIIIGTAVGTLTGILVPHWHKNRDRSDKGLSLQPYAGDQQGVTLAYKF